jgi:Poly (ADP-ribose) glycohydrolase (PARG), Macro domain fold
MSALTPIEQFEIEAAALFRDHPPRFHHPYKQLAYEVACPAGCEHQGTMTFSRWNAVPLPEAIGRSQSLRVEVRPDFFRYEPSVPPRIEWTLNFADPFLFCAYKGALLAQDEMQVAEHPALGALHEMLLATRRAKPLTVEGGAPTPVLVAGVERRLVIHTEPDAAAGRPGGLYGHRFTMAPRDVVARALERLDPPTVSNILAMAAPEPSYGPYDAATIETVLVTAMTGFAAAVAESHRPWGADARTAIHTGFWGCGAFGGNRTVMVALQILAAHLAGLDRLIFHAPETADFEAGRLLAEDLLPPSGGTRSLANLIGEVVGRKFQWGESDGN